MYATQYLVYQDLIAAATFDTEFDPFYSENKTYLKKINTAALDLKSKPNLKDVKFS